MNPIRYHLKTSNKFIPNVSFDEDSFGQLNLSGYSISNPFKNSSILKDEHPRDLIKLCEFDLSQKWKLLYRASRDGFGTNHFNSKCDNHANTLCIFKAKGTEFIFGAFTTATWNCSGQYQSDPNAFLFSLTNKDN